MFFRTGIIFLTLILLSTLKLNAQTDSLVLKNGDYIVGEVKGLYRNVLTIETDYSDDDFKIEWDGVKEIYCETYFLISLTDGKRFNGYLRSSGPGKVNILTDLGQEIEVVQDDIVILEDINEGFWSRLYASVDFGFDLTKSQNLRQFSMRSSAGYIARRWQLDLSYNSLRSKQDDAEDILRTDGSGTFKYFLPRDWYPLASLEFLSNTEQDLQLRTTSKIGLGKYIIHTNRTYWGFSAGANNNNEQYLVDSIPDRNTWEGFIGTELNFFNIGDLDLLTTVVAYPSISDAGRWRTDFKFDAKYDLPLDFYIKLGFTLNYDNRPPAGSSESDYVLHTGFGWEW